MDRPTKVNTMWDDMKDTIKKHKTPIIGVSIVIIIVLILIGISVSKPTVSGSEPNKTQLNNAKSSKLQMTKTASGAILTLDDKPWCYETSYEFTQTVSGVTSSSSTVKVAKSTTATFPKIQLGDIVSGSTINVIKNVYKDTNTPIKTTIEFSGGKFKKDGKDTELYELSADGLFIDYDNACQDYFKLDKPTFGDSIPIDTLNISPTPPVSNANITYIIQFVSRDGRESSESGKIYISFTPNADATFNKYPFFDIMSPYGKDGLRIQRKKLDGSLEMLKKEYEEPVSTVNLTTKLRGIIPYFQFRDTNPIQVQAKALAATFKSFNNSFI
jgi:hypothetical protein